MTESIFPAAIGRDLLGALIAAGIIGPYARRVIIDADSNQVLRIITEHLGDRRLVEVVPEIISKVGIRFSGCDATPAGCEVPYIPPIHPVPPAAT